jgi:hypothetical protein
MFIRIFIIALSLFIMACKSDKETSGSEEVTQKPGLNYQVPEGWISEEPESVMRKAQFRLPGINGYNDASMSVFVFPGTGGTVDANLQRWFGQFEQPDGSPSAEKAVIEKQIVNNLSVTVVYLTGTYLKSVTPRMMGREVEEEPESAMLAAIVETDKNPWFFKAVGPQKTIDHWRTSFNEFVRSFRYLKNN